MWLALETSADRASVAVGAPGRIMAEEGLEGARRHAGALPGLVERVLADAGVPLASIETVVLSDGPGSFTGLRVGAAVAKAIVRARGAALHTVPALMAVAWAARPAPRERVLAVLNALRGEVYAAEYRFGPGVVEVLQTPTVWLPERLLSGCPVPDAVAGMLPEPLAARLAEWQGGHRPRHLAGAASAGALLELAGLAGATTVIVDVPAWEPVYGRPAEAQAKWERDHGRTLPDSPSHFR
jgi:tRNA threonylcarbamoyl adenosine modification protein YeaZ